MYFDDCEVGVGGEVVCIIIDWYVENLLRDVKVSGVIFFFSDKCFKSIWLIGCVVVELVVDLVELKVFVCIFGLYGVDKLCDGLLG